MSQPMPEPLDRQTLIALRARREAHRVASELLNPPLDPYRFYCRHCGRPLDNARLDHTDHIRCDACGLRTHLPAGCVAEIRRLRQTGSARNDSCCLPGASFADVAVWIYVLVAIVTAFCAL